MSHDAAIVELQQHAGTQFDPELVALFCDLYTNRAPTPDPTILAITNPQPQPTQIIRRERRVRAADVSSGTLAADGHGRVDLGHSERPVVHDRQGRRTANGQARDRGRLTVRACRLAWPAGLR